MKKIFLIVSLFSCVMAFSQSQVQFTTIKHSFGKIEQNKPKSFVFTFKNISSKPIVVEVATAECGCTTPEYPKAPIAKGKTDNIKVTYNAATPGAFSKKVTVKFANIDEPVTLTIEGQVIEKKG
jgi:hypothetical protein